MPFGAGTRVFFTTENAAVSPSFDLTSSWDGTSSAIRKKLAERSQAVSAEQVASPTLNETSGGTWKELGVQFISDPIKAQTLSPSASPWTTYFQGMGVEASGQANAYLAVVAYVIKSDLTLRGVLQSYTVDNVELPSVSSPDVTDCVARAMGGTDFGGSMSEVVASDGDRIVIEMGIEFQNAKTTAYDAIFSYGFHREDPPHIWFSDTNTDGTSWNNWWQFTDGEIEFQSYQTWGEIREIVRRENPDAASISATLEYAIPAVDDLLIALHFTNASVSDCDTSGFVEDLLMNNATDSDQAAVYSKVCAGGSDNTVTCSSLSETNDQLLALVLIRGPFKASPKDLSGSSGRSTSNPVATGASGSSTAQADEIMIGLEAIRDVNDRTEQWDRQGTATPTSDLIELDDYNASEGSAIRSEIGYQVLTGIGTVGISKANASAYVIMLGYVTYKKKTGTTYNESLTLTSSAAASLAAVKTAQGSISLVASAGDSLGDQIDFVGALTLLATGEISMQGALEILSLLSLSSNAGIAQSGGLAFDGALSMAASAGITPTGAAVIDRAISIMAAAGITPTANNIIPLTHMLTASFGMVLAGVKNVTDSLGLDASAGITHIGGLDLLDSLSMAASAGISESGDISKEVSLILGVSAQIAISTIVEMLDTLNLPASAGMAYGTALVMGAAVTLAAAADIAQEGTLGEFFETLSMAANAGFTISAEMAHEASLTLPASGQMALSAATLMQSNYLMNAIAGLSSVGGLSREGSVTLGAQFSMARLAGLLLTDFLTLAIHGDLTPAAVKEIEVSTTLAAAVQQAQAAVWSGNVSIALGILADFAGAGAAKIYLSHKIFEALLRKRTFESERDFVFEKIRKGNA